MKILSMIATFGKLDGDNLTLEPGLNVIQAPNEWGKSTWCAFLVAMLYGVETRERTAKGAMADKERYAPWSGKAMEGLLRVEYRGRDITIQRRAKGRVPLGEFQAFETNTGLAVPELTAENCGKVLLGVEKSVFLRTGFLKFTDLSVIPDEALWQRLHALVTTGDESGSAAQLQKKLKELKNKIRSPRSGLIPEAERHYEALNSQLRERQALEDQCARLKEREEALLLEQEALERHSRVCAYREAKENREQVTMAREAALEAQQAVEELREQCADLPTRSELLEELDKSQELLSELEETPSLRTPSGAWTWLSALGALAGAAAAVYLFLKQQYILAAAAALAFMGLALLAGVASDRRRRVILRHQAEQGRRERSIGELLDTTEELRRQLSLRDALEEMERTAQQTRIRLQSFVATARQAVEEEAMDQLDLSPEETEERLLEGNRQLQDNRLKLGQCQGRMESLPELAALHAGLADCLARIKELERYERALSLAMSRAEEASRELQRRFAPRITALTRDYLSRLTDGKYNRVMVGEDLSVLAAGESETTLRGSAWRSDGTADVMYLALRLAVWVLLNPEGPLVLDDALLRLDDQRLEQAMELLSELGETRQIILFSCQSREEKWLNG